jgi:hypothetical protein
MTLNYEHISETKCVLEILQKFRYGAAIKRINDKFMKILKAELNIKSSMLLAMKMKLSVSIEN